MKLGTRERPDGCISDLTFDRWFAGELDDPALADARGHLDGCPRCREHHAALAAERSAFLALRPHPELRSAVPPRARGARIALGGGLLAAAAAVALVLVGRPAAPDVAAELRGDAGSRQDATRSKGAAHIAFFVQRGERAERGEGGGPVHPGELVRFAYSSPQPAFLAIYGRTAGSPPSTYFPSAEQPERVPAAQDALLPTAVLLDAALGAETVYALFCDAPFSVEDARARLGAAGTLAAPPGCRLDTLSWTKVRAPAGGVADPRARSRGGAGP